MKTNHYARIVEDLVGIAERSDEVQAKKRLVIEVSANIHNKIKANALYKNMKYRDYVLRALAKELALDKDLGF